MRAACVQKILPWLRTLIALALGIAAIEAVHFAGGRLLPGAYAPPGAGSLAGALLGLMLLAGIAGTFVTVLVARHRPWLHATIFLAMMLALDAAAAVGVFAEREAWFKVLMLASLPLQAWLGAKLALRAWPQPATPDPRR